MRRLAAASLALAALAGPPHGAAQEREGLTAEEREAVERILELQRQIDALLQGLSPAAREELTRRLAAPGGPEEAAAEAPPAAGAPATAPTRPSSPPAVRTPPEAAVASGPGEAAPEAATPPRAPEPAVEARRPAPARVACAALLPFDSDGDGTVGTRDRYWRYLYLWQDKNGDSQLQAGEVRSIFEHGVRKISVHLDTFEDAKERFGLIRPGELLVFDLGGNGFGDDDDAALAVDATALGRSTGPRVLAASGEPVEGIQPFRRGWVLRDSAGRVTDLGCR